MADLHKLLAALLIALLLAPALLAQDADSDEGVEPVEEISDIIVVIANVIVGIVAEVGEGGCHCRSGRALRQLLVELFEGIGLGSG